MDHIGILKRAWNITWRYRALWILGLFAGAGGGGGGSGSGWRGSTSSPTGSSSTGGLPFTGDQALRWFEANLAVIIIIATLLFLIGLIWWILSVAARGGLVWLSNEAAEGRQVRAGDGWGAGFHYWGRTFLIAFLLGLPILVVLIVMLLMSGATILALIAAAANNRGPETALAAGGLFGLCGAGVLAFIVLIPLGILLGLLGELALRHGVLDDSPAVASIKMSWQDVRHRFGDVIVMWLMMVVVGIVYGIVIGIAALVFVLPAVGFAVARMWAVAVVLGVMMVLLLLVPGAIYGAFYSTAWTLFFRRLTGREVAAPVPAPAYAAPGAGYPAPPSIPQAPEPPAMPPMPPAPEPPPAPPVPPAPGGQQPPPGTP